MQNHHKLFIGFLNTFLDNTVQIIRNLKGISQSYKTFLFLYFYHVYFILWNKSKKDVTQKYKGFNLWSFRPLHFLKILFPVRDQKFITFTQRGSGEFLKLVTCLQMLLFLNCRSIVHFCIWGVGEWVSGEWLADVIIVWSLILKLTLIKK